MLETGAIDRPTFKSARAAKPVIRDGLREDEPYGQYFKEHVRRELVDRFGWQRVYQGGLSVFSTIDLGMQQAAEAAVADGLKAVESRRRALAAARRKAGRTSPASPDDADPLQAALFAMDPAQRSRPGDGGRPRFQGELLQPRRPGRTAAGLRVQAVRVCRSARGRLHAGDDDRQPRRADRDASRERGRPKTGIRQRRR